jgi:hypothetical protein
MDAQVLSAEIISPDRAIAKRPGRVGYQPAGMRVRRTSSADEVNDMEQRTPSREGIAGVGWYAREQWARLREVVADPEELEDTYEEWLGNAEKFAREMSFHGVVVQRIAVDVEALRSWCVVHSRRVNAESRAAYAAEMLRRSHQAEL